MICNDYEQKTTEFKSEVAVANCRVGEECVEIL